MRAEARRHRYDLRQGRERAVPLGLAALAFLAALLQRPGQATADTKIDLHVDPVGFLGDVAAVWTNTGALGEVQGGQYVGYLFPMGPFFALGDWLGLADWLVARLWLGAMLAFAAWGVVRLLDALMGGRRGIAHLVAGLLVVFNPYTVVYANRAAVTLLGLAVLPWLLLAVHRGLREPTGWRWPAAIALLVASSGAGVNAAVAAWVLLGPLALAGYERLTGAVGWPELRSFAWRTLALGLVASAWWAVPVLIQTLYGIDFLQFTEQPGAIWSTTSITESLRLMGYWPSYLGLGFGALRPFYDSSPDLLYDPVVLVATLVVPALAVGGFACARRWRYGPFFLALVLLGLVVMSAGFPPGTPLRQGATFTYNHISAVQFLRTTHKAGPLVVLGLACLAGYGAAALWAAVPRRAGALLALGGAALLAVSVWPLTTGRGVDEQVVRERVPAAWEAAARDLDRSLAPNSRAVILPGQLLAFYRWGGTVDPILPALTDRPVAVRQFVPRADLHAVDVLWTVDALVQQERLVPGQLRPLLALMGAGALVTGADDDPSRSGAPPAADAARALGGQGLGRPDAAHGPVRARTGLDGGFEQPAALAQVRRHDLDGGRGIVRVQPAGPPTIVDGSAGGLADLAAFGALPALLPVEYAADRERRRLVAAAERGAELVVSDSNRRRVFVPARLRQSTGATLGPDDPVSEDAALLDPFPERGNSARTVSVLDGARYLRAPFSPGFAQFPEHRPAAALDGSRRTEWLADSRLEEHRRWLEVGFEGPRDVPFVDLLPAGGSRTAVVGVEVGDRFLAVEPGWNRLRIGLRDVDRLRLSMVSDLAREDVTEGNGIAELRVPGLHVREYLRPPTILESALRGADLGRSGLSYLFSRTTADRPYRRDGGARPVRTTAPSAGEDPDALRIRDAEDPEAELARSFRPPAARSYAVDAWVSVSPEAPDDAIDRLAGLRAPVRFRSSGRFQGLARHRASSAFDGDAGRAWVADRLDGSTPYVEWETPAPARVRRLRIVAATLPAGRPTVVRLTTPRATGPRLRVGATGIVEPPRALSGRRFRLEVLEAEQPGEGRGDTPATVAIAEIEGAGVPRADLPAAGPLEGRCGAATVRVGGRVARLRPRGTVAGLEAGLPLRARACGKPLALAPAEQRLTTRATLVRVDHLRLRSRAPAGLPAVAGGGALLEAGSADRGRHEGVRVRIDGPAWLVLGESFNRGWRAECDGRDLGPPVVVDGYANGWRPPRDCREVELAFAPQRAATAGYVISGLACPALLAILLLGARRRRDEDPSARPEGAPAPARRVGGPGHAGRAGPGLSWPLRRALLAGLLAAAAFGFVFALRAGPAIGALVALVLWRGIGVRALVAAAVALLAVVVPAIYLLFPAEDRGGYNSGYAQDLLGAHWVGVAAFVLLFLALARSLGSVSRATGRDGARAAARAGAAPGRAQA